MGVELGWARAWALEQGRGWAQVQVQVLDQAQAQAQALARAPDVDLGWVQEAGWTLGTTVCRRCQYPQIQLHTEPSCMHQSSEERLGLASLRAATACRLQ